MKPEEIKISRKYAKAIFNIARDHGSLDVIKKDFENFVLYLSGNGLLRNYFCNSVIQAERKTALIESVFKNSFSVLFRNILNVVIEKKRMHIIYEISAGFSALVDEEKGVVRGVVVTAVPASNGKIEQIEAKLSKKYNKKVVLEVENDPSLMGGMMIRIKDKIIDGTISGYIKRLKKELMSWK